MNGRKYSIQLEKGVSSYETVEITTWGWILFHEYQENFEAVCLGKGSKKAI